MKFKVFYVPALLWVCGGALVAAAFVYGAQKDFGAWFWVLLIAGIAVLSAGFYELHKNFKEAEGEAGAGAGQEPAREMPEYRKKRALLSKPESDFYRLLQDFLSPDHFDIIPQTALVSVIEKLTQTGYRNELFRIADFCITDAPTTEPLLLIELNDASHRRADRQERDRRVAEICAHARLPLVTFSPEEAADEGYVRKTLKRYL
ncbi:MAG: DUF2726 domain-containing protein [Firmicutes bacterium]|nr:DUF2726 domain-containing protein [Bacillota bacterium]